MLKKGPTSKGRERREGRKGREKRGEGDGAFPHFFFTN